MQNFLILKLSHSYFYTPLPMSDILDSSHMFMVYSSFQLHRYLVNIGSNRGTEDRPINVDNMVRVVPYPPFGSDIDTYISEVPYELKSITWSIKKTGFNSTSELSEPTMCRVEIYGLDPCQKTCWGKYFVLNCNAKVNCNDVLILTPDDSGNLSIDLQENGDDLLFGYSLVFTIDVKIGEDTKKYICRRDPIANIRSRRTT